MDFIHSLKLSYVLSANQRTICIPADSAGAIIHFPATKKPFLLSAGTVILMAFLYKDPVFQYFEVQDGDLIEALSIPTQQLAFSVFGCGQASIIHIIILKPMWKKQKATGITRI